MYYFWDNWELYHKCVFDGVNRLIYVSFGTTTLDIKTDVYSDWKEWTQIYDNAKYLAAIRTIGGDSLGNNTYAGDIYFLINGWKLVVDLTKVKITGALYSDDYDTAYYDANLNPQYPATVAQLVQTVKVPENVVTGDPSTIAAQVWDALLTNHLTAGTFGQFVQNIPSAVWDQPSIDHLAAGTTGETLSQIKADTGSISISTATLNSLINTVLKYEKNRTKIDTVNKQMIVYDNDGTTILQIFNLKDSTGAPSVAEVCERVPTL